MDPNATTPQTSTGPATVPDGAACEGTVETRVWAEEHEWLLALRTSAHNVAPRFRCPDLIGACVTLVLGEPDGVDRLFHYMSTVLALRERKTTRRECLWTEEHKLLMAAQASPANRHPNPMFQLDQLTTGCVALARMLCEDGKPVFKQARINMAARTTRRQYASMF